MAGFPDVPMQRYMLILLAIALALVMARAAAFEYGLEPVYKQPQAPPLTLDRLRGEALALDDYRGRVVLINFWATWCPPCVQELPAIQELRGRFERDQFEVLAVNLGEDIETIEGFLDQFETSLDFPILLARDQSIMQEWKVLGLPTTFIVDKAGRQRYRAVGPRDFAHEHIVSRVGALIAE